MHLNALLEYLGPIGRYLDAGVLKRIQGSALCLLCIPASQSGLRYQPHGGLRLRKRYGPVDVAADLDSGVGEDPST